MTKTTITKTQADTRTDTDKNPSRVSWFARVAPPTLAALLLSACAIAPGGSGALPEPTVELAADTVQGELPLIVTLTARTPGLERPVLGYGWDFGNGETSEGGRTRTVVYTEEGSYTASVEVAVGAQVGVGEVELEVLSSSLPRDINNQPPFAELEADVTEGSAPLTVSLTASAEDPNEDELAYTLHFGDGNRTAAAEASHTYTEPGTYVATVVVTDGRRGVGLAETTITVE